MATNNKNKPISQVNTTLGPISIDQLGKVNVHEHIVIDRTNNHKIPEDFHHVNTSLISSDLTKWKEAGGGVIVDTSPIGAGRNILILSEISQATNVPIVISSGFHKLSYYREDHWAFSLTDEELFDILIKECTQGIILNDWNYAISKRHQAKANMLKIGLDREGITIPMQKIITAVSAVSNQTGVPCMVHTEPGMPFDDLMAHFEQMPCPPKKIIFCHMGKSLDTNLYMELAARNYFLEFDEMIRPSPPLEVLAEAIINLFENGYGNYIFFAGDLARRSYWPCYGGKPGLRYLITQLEQDLIKLGFTQEMIDQIWIDNPRSVFT